MSGAMTATSAKCTGVSTDLVNETKSGGGRMELGFSCLVLSISFEPLRIRYPRVPRVVNEALTCHRDTGSRRINLFYTWSMVLGSLRQR